MEYGINVWNVDARFTPTEIARRTIDATGAFFTGLGIPMTLTELSIGEENFAGMAAHTVQIGNLQNSYVPLAEQDVEAILEMCL